MFFLLNSYYFISIFVDIVQPSKFDFFLKAYKSLYSQSAENSSIPIFVSHQMWPFKVLTFSKPALWKYHIITELTVLLMLNSLRHNC